MMCHCCPMEASETVMIDGQEYMVCRLCGDRVRYMRDMAKGAEAMIAFTVYGTPQPKGSTRSFVTTGKDGKSRAVTTSANPKLKDWHHMVAWSAQENRPKELMRGAVGVSLAFTLLRPASVSEKKRPYPTVRPDMDKLERAILDALKGTVYADDCLVIDKMTSKRYGDAPGVEIKVWEVC